MSFETDARRGVQVHYGTRVTNKKFGGIVDDDIVKHVEYVFNYNDLPTNSTSALEHRFPAGAKILSARFEVLEAFTSTSTTTDLDVGLFQSNGTAIDADGLLTAAQLTQTVIGTAGALVLGTGALVGATIGSAAGELKVTPTVNDLTAGKARILVTYLNQAV